jgi:hypothetical protein
MSEELLKIIQDLKSRLESAENRIEDLENRKPMRGEKGAPGDIQAALYNVEEAAPKLVAAELKKLQITESVLQDIKEHIPVLVDEGLKRLQITELRGEKGAPGKDGVGEKGDRGARGESATAPTKEIIERLVQSAVIGALNDYQFLDTERPDQAGAMLRYVVEQIVEQELKKQVTSVK